MLSARFHCLIHCLTGVALLAPVAAHATKAKLDRDACAQLRAEEKKFRQAGILSDMSKGADWAKANLSAERLREVQHYIELDEQVQFGCRDARLSVDAQKASEAAARIEINSDADPTIPVVKDPVKPGATPAVTTKKQPANKTTRKKPKSGDPKSGSLEPPEGAKPAARAAAAEAPTPAPERTGSTVQSPDVSAGQGANQLMFGFGETMVLPHSGP